MKNEGARVVTTLYSYILDAQGQLTCSWSLGVAKIKLIQTFMGALLPARLRKIHSTRKNAKRHNSRVFGYISDKDKYESYGGTY